MKAVRVAPKGVIVTRRHYKWVGQDWRGGETYGGKAVTEATKVIDSKGVKRFTGQEEADKEEIGKRGSRKGVRGEEVRELKMSRKSSGTLLGGMGQDEGKKAPNCKKGVDRSQCAQVISWCFRRGKRSMPDPWKEAEPQGTRSQPEE